MAVWLVRPKRNLRNLRLEKVAFENGVVFVGWEEIPNLTKIKSKEELIDLYRKQFPQTSGKVPAVHSGALWAFSHHIKRNDLVVFSLSIKSKVAIGEVIGPYKYRIDLSKYNRHTIPVRWIHTEVPRAAFDKDLQYSFRSLIQVCRVKRKDAQKRVLMACRLEA